MPSLAHRFGDELNTRLFEAMGEAARIDGVQHVGMFNRRHREVEVQPGMFVGVDLTFDCSYTQQVAELVEDDVIEIETSAGQWERFCFRRRIPDQGDETKRVILALAPA